MRPALLSRLMFAAPTAALAQNPWEPSTTIEQAVARTIAEAQPDLRYPWALDWSAFGVRGGRDVFWHLAPPKPYELNRAPPGATRRSGWLNVRGRSGGVIAVGGHARVLGLSHALQLSMEEAAARSRPAADDPGLTRVLLALPAVGLASAISMGAAAVLMVMRGILGGEWPFALAGTVLYGSMVIVAARTVMRASRTLYSHASHQAHAAATQRTAANTARLDALQARMNPHVLFNALNTVASLVRTNPPAAERVVEAPSDVLRPTPNRSPTPVRTLRGPPGAWLRRWSDRSPRETTTCRPRRLPKVDS